MVREIKCNATILVAEDDPGDRLLIEKALKESNAQVCLAFCQDGEDALNYLYRQDKYEAKAPRPALILLDLNMPKKNGREVLKEIKGDPELKAIPIVVLTTSSAIEDINEIYSTGGNSFITKPATFAELTDVLKQTKQYWLETVDLPEIPD